MNIKEMYAKQDELHASAKALASTDEDKFTPEMSEQIDQHLADATAMKARIDQLEKIEEASKVVLPPVTPNSHTPLDAPALGMSVVAEAIKFEDVKPRATIPATAKRYSKLTAFKGPDAELKAFTAGSWFNAVLLKDQQAAKYCQDNGIDVRAAMDSTSNPDGGFIIYPEFSNTLIDLVETYGRFRANARSWPMGSDSLTVPKLDSGLTAHFTAENTAPTESAPKGSNITLVAKELATLTYIPRSLSDDAVINMADLIATQIGKAFALKEDTIGFQGTGSQTDGKIHGAAVKIGTSAHTASIVTTAGGSLAFENFTLKEFGQMLGLLPDLGYAPNELKWYISRPGYYSSMDVLKNAAGGNTAQILADGTDAFFMGYPVVFVSVMNSDLGDTASIVKVLFGSLEKAAAFGNRALMGVEVDTAGVHMIQRQIAILGTERIDINVHLGPSSTSVAGPLIGLKTNSGE